MASWKVSYVSWAIILNECLSRHLCHFSRHVSCYQDTYVVFQDTCIVFKTLIWYSRHIVNFSRRQVHVQELWYFFKTLKICSRHIVNFQETLTSWKRCLGKPSWKRCLGEPSWKKTYFFQDGSPRHLSRHLFKRFQDAGVLENRLERCLDSIASWNVSRASWRILFMRCASLAFMIEMLQC